MLQSMREGAYSKIMKGVLLTFMTLAVAGLVLMDVGGFFSGQISSNNVVAKGSGIKISAMEFDRTVRRALNAQGIGAPEAYRLGMIHNILVGEIQQRLLSKQAQKLGLRVSDDLVTEQISRIAEPLATDGAGRGEALKQVLRQQGISEGEFISSVRQEMANGVLKGALSSGAIMVPDLFAR